MRWLFDGCLMVPRWLFDGSAVAVRRFFVCSLMVLCGSVDGVTPAIDSDKLYCLPQEICMDYFDSFYIHLGHNVWTKTGTIHRDNGGIYFYDNGSKEWKCPYCFMYWPLGSVCENEQCKAALH